MSKRKKAGTRKIMFGRGTTLKIQHSKFLFFPRNNKFSHFANVQLIFILNNQYKVNTMNINKVIPLISLQNLCDTFPQTVEYITITYIFLISTFFQHNKAKYFYNLKTYSSSDLFHSTKSAERKNTNLLSNVFSKHI